MKSVKIQLKKSEIYYDIENSTYIVGLNRSTGDNFEQVSNIQNKGEEEDRNFIRRSIETAFSELKRNVNRFISVASTESLTNSNALPDTTDTSAPQFELDLLMPDNFNHASIDSVKNASHEFIVSSALYDWFSAVKPDEIAIYAARKTAANTNVLSALYRKKAPARPA